MILINITGGLTHVYLLLDIAVEKSILHVYLAQRPATRHGKINRTVVAFTTGEKVSV
jgi:hypothetical protein